MTRARELANSADKDFAGTVTVDNIVVDTDLQFATGATVTTILDEDNMGSDSAAALSTQQAIKAYVDTQVATVPTGDITEVTAGTGLTGGGTTGAVTLNIDSTVATLTGTQTLTNKSIDATQLTGTLTNAVFPAVLPAVSGANLTNLPAAGITAVVDDTTPQLGGDLEVNGNAITGSTVAINGSTGEFMITATENGPVALRYDNNLKLTTKSDGVDITGELQADSLDIDGNGDITGNLTLGGNLNLGDNDKAQFGAGSDGSIYSDGTNLIVEGQNADSEVRLLSDDRVIIGSKAWGESFAVFNDDGESSLYFDGTKRLATTATGVSVTGTVAATSYTGDGSALTGVQAGAGYFDGNNGAAGDTTNGKGDIFRVHSQTLTSNVTIGATDNALAVGPLTVDSSVTLTVNGNLTVV